MKSIISVIISVFVTGIAMAEQPRLSEDQAKEIASIIVNESRYKDIKVYFITSYIKYDHITKLWVVPTAAFVECGGKDGSPIFELRDSDCYYRIGREGKRDKMKFNMSPNLKSKISVIESKKKPK